MTRPSPTSVLALLLSGASLGAAVIGFHALFRYETRPGIVAAAEARRPGSAPFAAPRDANELVLFAHPFCPCTRATFDNLELLLARARGELAVRVVVGAEGLTRERIEEGELWRRAIALRGVEAFVDADGVIARTFGARTSGEARVYARDGALLFQGGLTAARGHAGDCASLERVEALLRGLSDVATHRAAAPTFGCELTNCCEAVAP